MVETVQVATTMFGVNVHQQRLTRAYDVCPSIRQASADDVTYIASKGSTGKILLHIRVKKHCNMKIPIMIHINIP